ncbi:MAG TPA: 2Fe-2S iron-sulfur cluster-binding protein [Xanthomonadales bacterium]|nr:2Fe-2S iron-sulfur cluster-binding protein [Xanthomonadales bacterium]
MSTFEFEGRIYAHAPSESLLDALLRQGAEMPHSCRRGSCHTCIVKVEAGEVEASRQVDPALAAAGCTLACVAQPSTAGVRIRRVNADELSFEAELLARRQLADGVFALDIAPLRALTWRAGQFLQVRGPDGQRRPYSLASRCEDDYFLTIHVRRIDGGRVSSWLCDELQPGQRLQLDGPFGNCCYDPAMRDRPLRLLATGSGVGALAALAREALAQGHRAGIVLHHGVRRARDLYLHQELQALQHANPLFTYIPSVSGENACSPARRGRVVGAAFMEAPPRDAEFFLCGLPRMVEDARYHARRCGIPALQIHADAFEFAHPPAPRDAEKLAAIEPDPELWAALEHGRGLTRILNAFYALVFADPRLAPFFHHVSAARAAQKQYEFLASLFSGSGEYFGLNPFNAHHWMVISDELFDYREALFERVLRDDGLAPHLIDRWMALHELFRAEMVKAQARGMISQGVEQALRTHSVECLEIDTICDACGMEIPAGSPSRYLFRLGALHCAACAGIRPHADANTSLA